MPVTISIPIKAQYKIIDGKAVLQSAEYADVDPRIIVEMIFKAFGIKGTYEKGATT